MIYGSGAPGAYADKFADKFGASPVPVPVPPPANRRRTRFKNKIKKPSLFIFFFIFRPVVLIKNPRNIIRKSVYDNKNMNRRRLFSYFLFFFFLHTFCTRKPFRRQYIRASGERAAYAYGFIFVCRIFFFFSPKNDASAELENGPPNIRRKKTIIPETPFERHERSVGPFCKNGFRLSADRKFTADSNDGKFVFVLRNVRKQCSSTMIFGVGREPEQCFVVRTGTGK